MTIMNAEVANMYIAYLEMGIAPKKQQMQDLKDRFKNYVNQEIDNTTPSCFVRNAINDLLTIQELQDQINQMEELILFSKMNVR